MADRRKFILSTSAEFFETQSSTDVSAIEHFFDNDELTVLAVTCNQQSLTYKYEVPIGESSCLLFYKTPKSAHHPIGKGTTLGLLTLEGGLVKSAYNSVARVFSRDAAQGSDFPPVIADILESLKSNLVVQLGIADTGIDSIKDEIIFWNQKHAHATTKSDREAAVSFSASLEQIHDRLKTDFGPATNLSELDDFTDFIHNALDEIWKLPYQYPQNRMVGVMKVISKYVVKFCVGHIQSVEIWKLNSLNVNSDIVEVTDVVDAWMQVCDSLTRLFWPHYGQHAWTGEAFVPENGRLFKNRVEDIARMRNANKQVLALFAEDKTFKNMACRIFSTLENINCFDVSPFGQKRWMNAKQELEPDFEEIDDKIAEKLQTLILGQLQNPRQVVHLFMKYKNVIQRPAIRQALLAEREHLIEAIQSLLKDIKKMIAETNHDEESGSPVIAQARFLKIMEHEAKQIEQITDAMLSDRTGFEPLKKEVASLKEELQALMRVNYESWYEKSSSSIRRGELTLIDNDPVVLFDQSERQLMKVTFNPKLITFCHEVRDFRNLGYNVPAEFQKSATHAMKFVSLARNLQHISTVHNTIGDRMIPCQRPIMLKNAMELAKLVKSETVSWNNEELVSHYVTILQKCVNKLNTDNTFLIGCHEEVKKIVIKLMNTSLTKRSQTWREEMKNLRDIVVTLEKKGYSNLDPFKLHWDYQLYKVLEYQYVMGLMDDEQRLPDINVDIVFRQRQLQFRPPLEELRSKYYAQLRKFLEKPLGFRGLSDKSKHLFKVMVELNRHRFKTLYEKAERIIKELSHMKEIWVPWVALGCIDTEQLCSVHLTNWLSWDRNFKACKHFSQQIAKIQDTETRVDCFVVNLSPLRSDIEFISRRYWEALSMTLRSSILTDINFLQDYLTTALQVLRHIPQDESKIIEASAKYEKIVQEVPKMSSLIAAVQGKDTCLAGWCKERVSSLVSIQSQWEQLQPLIENHQSLLQGRLDIFKDEVLNKIYTLSEEAEKFLIRWQSTLQELESNEDADVNIYRDRLQQWEVIQEKRAHLILEAEQFNVEVPPETSELFATVEQDIKDSKEQWNHFADFASDFDSVNTEEWSVYRRRPYILTDFLTKWETTCRENGSSATAKISNILSKYRAIQPILTALQSDALTERHWVKIFQLLQIPPKPYYDVLLSDVIQNLPTLTENSQEIQAIVKEASSEQIVRQAISELEQWGVATTLKTTQHTDSRGNSVTIIKDFQDVLNKIGDNQSLLQAAKVSVAFDSFSDQAGIWETKLNQLDFILTNMNQIQRKWIYLEPIFSAGTLKSEEAVFARIDKDFRYIMREIFQDPRVLSLIRINNIQNVIDSLLSQLSRCQNTLTSYITNKRNAFARFYFLSNDDLLEILGQASKEGIIQKHIKKLFPGVHRLKLEEKGDKRIVISEIWSAEGDTVKLLEEIVVAHPVEEWLNKLMDVIKKTLQNLTKQCCQTQAITLEHIQTYPMQVFCIANSVTFTRNTEKAITSMSLPSYQKNIKLEISKYAQALHQTKNKLLQTKIRSLLFDLVYQSNTIQYLIDHNVTNPKDWYWLQQLRFCINKQDMVTVRMVYAEFEYSYEYLGNFTKLVYTSLTHNCYLTLTQAMHLGLGGNPFGPAGTGKTECVKALGSMLGRLVFVFNCNENVDADAMALILSGLARCGAFGCFDEFNRLHETTLSAISMMIQPLQTALKDKTSDFQILQERIPLNPNCCIFVTLNPASEDYGGRQKLPTTLQALFRPIVMQQPEPEAIAKVMLFVEGFQNAEEIGKKIVELFRLAEKMLSPQRHVDWGLRELKTVLMACGNALYENQDGTKQENELALAVNIIRTNTMSKLTLADCKRFNILIANVFPGVQPSVTVNSELRDKIEATFTTFGYQINERQIQKCLELNEQLTKRMGVVVLGPPSSGKSTIISILKEALVAMSKTIRTYVISPKSMNRVQLLGYLDPDTRQWNDGVMTNTAIAVTSESLDISSIIICDGDIDPEWIEALNSVLDDNHLLTLPSGWRIQFQDNVNFIFETHDLTHASPATISRMGIIYVSSEDLDDNLVLDSWVAKQADPEIMQLWMDDYFKKFLALKSEQKKFLADIPSKVMMKNPLGLLEDVKTKDEFCINLMRGIACLVSAENRNEFANLFFEFANIYVTDPKRSELAYFNAFRGCAEIYETEDQRVTTALVKTASMKFNIDVLKSFLSCKEKTMFLMVGPNGTGKSILLQYMITEFPGYQLLAINCSAQLISQHVLYALKQNCLIVSGIRGKEYKPKLSRLILYMKNLDLCAMDSYGTCEVVELLLQIYHRNGFYSESLEWISVSGLQICGSVTSLDKHSLSPRFLFVSKILTVDSPSSLEMQKIIESFFTALITTFKNPFNFKVERLAVAIIDFFKELQDNFTQDVSQHYKFTPKHIEQWIKGLTCYPEEEFQEALIYEGNRIFQDRLMTTKERLKFSEIISTCLRSVVNADGSNCYFVPSSNKSPELLLVPIENWKEIVHRNVSICNSEYMAIHLPIQEEQLNSIAQLCRCLSRPQTNILICGKSGIGRTESVAVACAILSIKLLFPTPIKNYSLNELYNDLKQAMQLAAAEDEAVVFVLDHCWLKYSSEFMKPVEAILQGSEIPDLFGDDLETIAGSLKSQAQLEGYQESMTSYFLKRVKSNLHLVLTLESSNGSLQELFKHYPVLYNNTEIIWMPNLASQSLRSLPGVILSQLNVGGGTQTVKLGEELFVGALQSCKLWRDSPKRNIQLIYAFNSIYNKFSDKKNQHFNKLKIGVDRLSSTHATVASLRKEAESKELELGEKRKLADQALQMISATMNNANNQKTDLLSLKAQTEESSLKLIERKKAIEKELALVEPLLKEASAAVSQIKSEALSEIRSLRAPPEIIRDILEGVLRLMGIRDTSWNSMKSFLAKRGVKEDIRSLDPSQISPENCASVEKLLKNKAESFDLKNAKRASAAAAPLTQWVKANVTYSKVMQSIKPLEREQNELKRNLDTAETEMNALSTGLEDVNARVKELSDQLNLYTQEAAVLEIKLEDARKVLRSAEVLVVKLDSEYTNWSKDLEELTVKIDRLDIESFLSALCVTHLADQNVADRLQTFQQLCSSLELSEFSIADNLLNEQETLIWQSMGLTPDGQSFENAAILKYLLDLPFCVSPVPLILDPTGSATQWLKNFLKATDQSFEVVSQNGEKFTYNLELAIRFGKTLLVEDPFPLTPPLLTVVLGKIVCRFNKRLIPVGNKLLDLHEDFKLILITKQDKMELPGNSRASIGQIPFTITMTGLTDQLISKCISIRQPELEQKRIELLRNESNLFEQKQKLQDQLLEELSSAQGNILQNEKLISTLNHIKESTVSIEASLRESFRVRQELTKDFDKFKEICENSASLFMGITRIYSMNIETFLKIFVNVIRDDKNASFKDAFQMLVKLLFVNLSRSTLKSEQIALGLNVAKQAFPNSVPDKEWDLFVFNFMGSSEGKSNATIPSWMKKEVVSKVQTLASQHPQLYEKMQLDKDSVWSSYMKSAKLQELPLQLSEFQKILVSQLLRPDQLISTIIVGLERILGFSFLAVSQPTIKQIAENGSTDEPILLLSAAGNDPSIEIKEYAATTMGKDKFVEIAIRKGQEQTTISKVRDAAKTGKWICIKNIHLMSHWLPQLDTELRTLTLEKDFRLWLTSDVEKPISDLFLNRCNKIVFEPPTGIKYKIRKLLVQYRVLLTQKRDYKVLKLYVALLILHSIVQERRTFVPQGWCKWYDFSDSDLRTAFDLVTMVVNANSVQIDWLLLRELCKIIVYGGKIDNEQDFQTLTSLNADFFDVKIMSTRWNPFTAAITIPNSNNLDDYQMAIEKLPDFDTPQLYGLPASTNISKDVIFCRNLLKTLRSKYIEDDTGFDFERRLKPILTMWRKLAANNNIQKLYKQNILSGSGLDIANPWTMFNLSELSIAAKLYRQVHCDLSDVHAMLKSTNAMSVKQNELLLTLCENQTPLAWRKIWRGPRVTTDFLQTVARRGTETEKRCLADCINRPIEVANFADFFSVDAFLSVIKLAKSRALSISTNDLMLQTIFTTADAHIPENCVKVAPLQIDCGTFKNNKLTLISEHDSLSTAQHITSHLLLSYEQGIAIKTPANCIELPLYTNVTREQFLCPINIPTSVSDISELIYAGTAIYVADN